MHLITLSLEIGTVITRISSSCSLKFLTFILVNFGKIGVSFNSVKDILMYSSMLWLPSALNSVISPLSYIPITSCPPSALENATKCLKMSFGLILPLFLSKY